MTQIRDGEERKTKRPRLEEGDTGTPASSIPALSVTGPPEGDTPAEPPATPPPKTPPPATPPNKHMLAGPPLSPVSKVAGKKFNINSSDWDELSEDGNVYVDKSYALKPLFDMHAPKAIAAFNPRRTGKSAFMSTIHYFASIYTSQLTAAERRRRFEVEDRIGNTDPEFFNEHFAKYAVISLDMKGCTPRSVEDAKEMIAQAVLNGLDDVMRLLGYQLSPAEHNNLLATLDADGHGTDIAEKLRAKFINNASLGASLVEQYAELDLDITAPGAFRKAMALLKKVMMFFANTFGDRRTIVLIDEFDTPFTFLAAKVSNDDMRESIEEIFKEFYSSLVKGNRYVKRSILTGIHNACVRGLESGMNNVDMYFPHTLMTDSSATAVQTTFQHAFGFREQETRGLILNFVEHIWWGARGSAVLESPTGHRGGRDDITMSQSENTAASVEDRTLASDECADLLYQICIKKYDGYRIGDERHVFNPHAVLNFLKAARQAQTPKEVNEQAKQFWASTSESTIIKSIAVQDATDLEEVVGYLLEDYDRRAIEKEEDPFYIESDNEAQSTPLRRALDCDVDEYKQVRAVFKDNFRPDVRKRVAKACLGDNVLDLLPTKLKSASADTFLQICYTQGYLTPLSSNHVGIPNRDVYDSFLPLLTGVMERSCTNSTLYIDSIRDIGLSKGNVAQFATFLDELMNRCIQFGSKDREKDYQRVLQYLLTKPMEHAGYVVKAEDKAEAGSIDLSLTPNNKHSGYGKGIAKKPIIILELKRITTKHKDKYDKDMEKTNRLSVRDRTRKESEAALTQIEDRYMKSLMYGWNPDTLFFKIGVTFWRSRFYLLASKHRRNEPDDADNRWSDIPFTAEDYAHYGNKVLNFSIVNGCLHAENLVMDKLSKSS